MHDCLPDVHENMRSSRLSSTRCISTAAADTPAHGETGVRKPLANAEEHTHAVSCYHYPCYPMIIIKVSHVAVIVSAGIVC